MGNLIPTSEAAELTGLTADYIRDLCRGESPRVKSQKFGHVLMIDRESLLTHVQQVAAWRDGRKRKEADQVNP